MSPNKKKIDAKLKELYQQMSDHTSYRCGKKCGCHSKYRCCDKMYCELAREWARDKWNTTLKEAKNHPKDLPFMGKGGCEVPPHMRPLCTLHDCDISSLGFDLKSPEWTKRYFTIRAKIERLEGMRDGLGVQVLQTEPPAVATDGDHPGETPQADRGTDKGSS